MTPSAAVPLKVIAPLFAKKVASLSAVRAMFPSADTLALLSM